MPGSTRKGVLGTQSHFHSFYCAKLEFSAAIFREGRFIGKGTYWLVVGTKKNEGW